MYFTLPSLSFKFTIYINIISLVAYITYIHNHVYIIMYTPIIYLFIE